MNNITDFTKFKDSKKDVPDDDFRYFDEDGIEWNEYSCSYIVPAEPEDIEFGFSIWAKSDEDALLRMKLIKETGVIDGKIFSAGYIDYD